MFKLRQGIIWTVAVPIIMLATSGCATKKYVSQQVKPGEHQSQPTGKDYQR